MLGLKAEGKVPNCTYMRQKFLPPLVLMVFNIGTICGQDLNPPNNTPEGEYYLGGLTLVYMCLCHTAHVFVCHGCFVWACLLRVLPQHRDRDSVYRVDAAATLGCPLNMPLASQNFNRWFNRHIYDRAITTSLLNLGGPSEPPPAPHTGGEKC